MIVKTFLILGAFVASCCASYSIPVPVLVPELYRKVMHQECGVEYLKEFETSALAGTVVFHVTKEEMRKTDEADCTLRLTLPEDNRVALWVKQDEDQTNGGTVSVDCESSEITLVDTATGDVINNLCESEEPAIMEAHLSTDRSIDIRISVPDTVGIRNDTRFEATFLAFQTVTDLTQDCYICEKEDGNATESLCIDSRLKCDSVRNCLGEYKNEEAFTVTRDEHCTFVCNTTGLEVDVTTTISPNGTDETNAYILNGIEVCNVFKDCPYGEDEDEVLCARDEIFGPLGLAGGIIIILCALLLIIVIILGVRKRKQEVAKSKKRDANKYSKGEEPARGDAV